MQSFKGTFTGPSATGSQAISGLGFTPDVLIIWSTRTASSGTWKSAGSNFSWSIGVACNGGNSYALCSAQLNSTTCFDSGRISPAAADVIQTTTGNTGSDFGRANVSSWDVGGFTLNWSIASAGNTDFVYHYIALQGVSSSAAALLSVNGSATGTTGNQTFSIGGSTPDAVLMFHIGNATGLTGIGSYAAGIGAFDRIGNQWAITSQEKSSSRDVAGRAQVTDKCLIWLDTTSMNSIAQSASFVSVGAGTFTLNFPAVYNNGGSLKTKFLALALVGCNAHVGHFNKNTATGAQVVSSGVKPTALIMATDALATSSSVTTLTEHFSFGASDGTRSGYTIKDGIPATNPGPVGTDFDHFDNTNGILGIANNSSATIDDLATLTSFDGGGTFTLNWSTSSATAREICYLALASRGLTGPRAAQNFFICRT
jgi:hypothetical protein